jgi:outer membrane protein OmpA-like peptidoglycan-associated protein
MKTLLLLSLFLLSAWATGFCTKPNKIAIGENNEHIDVKYTDYLPRYRKIPTDFIITKVEYSTNTTILHFRFVGTTDKEIVRFFGSQHAQAWSISTNQRANNGNEKLEREAEIRNVRVNDNSKSQKITAKNVIECQIQKGDIITCEISFENMPHYVRTINLVNGETDKIGMPRFVCYDLQLKGQSSPLLGDKNQMQSNIEQFYRQHKGVRYPSIIEVTTLQQDSIFAKGQQKHVAAAQNNGISNAARPIDYMPRMLQTSTKLTCHERFILENVYFEEESADFSRRSQAMKTLNILIEHLNRFPDAKIALHGHTDIFGDPYNNLVLSEKRVLAVQRAMTDKGIDRKRIIINFYGGKHPLPLYKDGGPMNRRVEAEIICPAPVQKPE